MMRALALLLGLALTCALNPSDFIRHGVRAPFRLSKKNIKFQEHNLPLSVATATSGTITGAVSTENPEIQQFLGIPYAQAPVGQLRFQSPKPLLRARSEKFNTTSFGAACIQLNPHSGSVIGSEDCLFVNVWRHGVKSDEDDALPVLVWIHGGYFFVDASSNPEYNPINMLTNRAGFIFVSINYRLGPFGFLSAEALRQNAGGLSSGMWGIEDQRLALNWIQDNIRSFGGDPRRVTIMGESAGATSVCLHMVSPLSRQRSLFSQAILQSHYCDMSGLIATQAESEVKGTAFFNTLLPLAGLTAATCNLACQAALAVSLPAANVLYVTAQSGLFNLLSWSNTITPNIDGLNLVENPLVSFVAGRVLPVPTLVGSNAQEFAIFLVSFNTQYQLWNPSDQLYQFILLQDNLNVPPSLLPRYLAALGNFTAKRENLIEFASAAFFQCGARRLANAVSKKAPAFLYSFNHAPYATLQIPLPPTNTNIDFPFAYHSAEVPFVFQDNNVLVALTDELGSFPPVIADSPETTLSNNMQSYWLNFVFNGRPSSDSDRSLPRWAPYDSVNQISQNLDLPISSQRHRFDFCDTWDATLQAVFFPQTARPTVRPRGDRSGADSSTITGVAATTTDSQSLFVGGGVLAALAVVAAVLVVRRIRRPAVSEMEMEARAPNQVQEGVTQSIQVA